MLTTAQNIIDLPQNEIYACYINPEKANIFMSPISLSYDEAVYVLGEELEIAGFVLSTYTLKESKAQDLASTAFYRKNGLYCAYKERHGKGQFFQFLHYHPGQEGINRFNTHSLFGEPGQLE